MAAGLTPRVPPVRGPTAISPQATPRAGPVGAAISGYAIPEWRFIEPPVTIVVDGPGTTAVITGLTNGHAYQFQVAATNSRGTGEVSEWSNAVVPARPPGVPTDVTATA